ncbi:MAG: molybdopterin-dependent oxidoreductase [Candidatus Methylarchaceae archaeon HK01B]|nr:molybdopterin-dependent oxidoreductase [Candidatus Methylarchaceae archaeon HK02M1]MCP8318263.1 molybdopterin-dependent oxidoreductase [Candidatus Methylarchaceae archaeon HK01B]
MATITTFALGEIPEVMATTGEYPRLDRIENYLEGQTVPSICLYCAGGCGVRVTTLNGEIIETEGDPDHPINSGRLCSKPSAYPQLIYSERRILYPMKRTNPNKGENEDPGWVQITWDEAYSTIASKIQEAMENVPYKRTNTTTGEDDYYYVGKDSPVSWLGSSYWNNEECYLGRKLTALIGSNNIEHQARKCHASTVVGLGSTFGFGAMTNHIIDAKNSKVFLIVSNPAESHSMEFRWVTEAVLNGAKIINLDPRFNRTSTKADIFARYRSGSEAAIYLGLIRYTIINARYDKNFLETRTNAPYDLDGNFLSDWETNPDSIFSKLKAIAEDYTPEEVYKISGIAVEKFDLIADTFTDLNNRPGNIYYAMGTTQHTNASQAIRAQAILQLLLGNMGVPGGGVNALRGISNVQGSTDMNMLMHLIMGYRAPPRNETEIRRYQKWKNYDPANRGGSSDPAAVKANDNDPSYTVWEQRYYNRHFPTWNSLEYNWGMYVGTWPGIDPDNESIVCDLPVDYGYPIVALFRKIWNEDIKVLICNGENPAVSMPNAELVRDALSKVFLVVEEIFETETAWFADILLPGTVQVERSGSITNTGRWIQWRWKAIDPPGECKPELEYVTELYQKIREDAGVKLPSERYKDDTGHDTGSRPEDCWPSPYASVFNGDPYTAEDVYKEIGAKSLDPSLRPGYVTVQPAANVIYKNSYDPELDPSVEGILAKRRDPTPLDSEDAQYGYFKNWAFSWMLNQRVLYNINESHSGVNYFFTWWALNDTTWLGFDKGAVWSRLLFNASIPDVKNPLSHGMPLHNEPLESPDSELEIEYPTMWGSYYTYYNVYEDIKPVEIGDSSTYPYVLTTFRLAEHMQAGALTRNVPWLVELFPEVFVEMSPTLASKIGVSSGDYVLLKTARNPDGDMVKCVVTDRIQPLIINGKTIHEVAMPWHWGFRGLSTGLSANVLTMDAVDVSAHIPEYKACLCKVEKV